MLTRIQAYGLLALLALVWGANWPVLKSGLTEIGPYWLTALRNGSGMLSFLAVLVVSGRLRLPDRRDLPLIVTTAAGQIVGFMLLVNLGLTHVEAGRSALLAYTTPLWVTPLAMIVLGERLTPLGAVGLVLGLTGLATLFNPLAFDWTNVDVITGNGFLLLAAFCWAGTIVHARKHRWVGTSLDLAFWPLVLGIPFLTGLATLVEPPPTLPWSAQTWAVLAYVGPMGTAFAFWCSMSIARSLPSITTSLGLLSVPVVGMLLSAVTLGEALTLTNLGGLALILSGIGLIVVSDAPART